MGTLNYLANEARALALAFAGKTILIGASVAALTFTPSAPASAATVTLTGTYTVLEAIASGSPGGGPSVSGVLSGSLTIPNGGALPGATFNVFTLSPFGSCIGAGCSGGTETDNITFKLTGLTVKIGSNTYTAGPITENGVFSAKYGGAILGCASGDGVSPLTGDTDCLVWSGASSTYNGSFMVSDTLSNGQTLDVTFHNATDWNITPTVSFDVVAAGAPEPSTWAMMLAGFAGLGFAAYRRRRSAISIV